jgi:epoxide hydrolase-like predicted phosphatase
VLKAVIFDWGGVLMRTVDASARRRWEQRLGLPPHAVDRAVHGSRAWHKAQLGEVSDAQYWADVAAQLGLDPAQVPQFRRDYFSGDQLDREMLQYIRDLRPRYRTGLLSNASPHLRQELEQMDVTGAFDAIVISGQVGVQKPDAEIYRLMLERLEVAPGEALFVDDFEENVRGARRVGMQALHFRPDLDWRAKLERRLGSES